MAAKITSDQKQIMKDDSIVYDEIITKWHNPPFLKRPDIRLVVSGLIGAGKSTLVNSLTGTEKCATGDSSEGSYTTSTKKVLCEVGHTKVLVCDTRGFKSKDEDIKQHAKDRIYDYFKSDKHCNIFIYAMRMTDTRFEETSFDLKVLRELTRKCGLKLWKNGLIVLTNANICITNYKESHPSEDIMDWYSKKLAEWTEKLQKFMKDEVHLDEKLIQTIPIVAAGLPTGTNLETEPKGTSWIINIWLSILSTTRDSLYSQPLIIDILIHKIFKGPETSGDTIIKFLLNHHLCYLGKALQSEVFHDLKRKRVIGLACSFLHAQKHMLKYHLAMQSQRDCDCVLEYWKNASLSVDVLVAGSCGSGKTSLTNSLFYWKEELPEGHGIDASSMVSEKVLVHNDLNLTCKMWDTPGCDTKSNLDVIGPIYTSNKIGLLFFCITIMDRNSSIEQSVREFTDRFGESVWQNAVIVLTFANTIAPDKYKSEIKKKKECIKSIFQTMSNSKSIAIIPAGYHTNLHVSGDPDKKFWFVDLWMKAISVTQTMYQPVMITILNNVFLNLFVKEKEMEVHYKCCLIDLLYSISLKNDLISDPKLQ